jgi:hypothetical protein
LTIWSGIHDPSAVMGKFLLARVGIGCAIILMTYVMFAV